MARAHPVRLSAGVVVVRHAPEGWQFLLLRAYGNWGFPKGLVEPGEDPLAGALREVREETTLDDLSFHWGHEYRETEPYSNKIARYYLAATTTAEITLPVSPELGHPEHDKWCWFDLQQALSLCSRRLEPILLWAAQTIGVPKA